MFGKWIENIKNMKMNSEPFNHIVIDDFLDQDCAEEIYKSFPTDFDNWYKYWNPIEVKYTNNNLETFDKSIQEYFKKMESDECISIFSKLSEINNLESDPTLHGSGLHAHPNKGRLGLHLDYEKHPKLENKQRRLNIILFMTKNWKEEWNGANELWDKDVTECKVKTFPKFNRAIIFKTNEFSWHGLPEIINCPDGVYRKSLAYYYLSSLESKPKESKYGAGKSGYREKASFIKRPCDPYDERIEKLYKIRPFRRISEEDIKDLCWV